MDHAIEGEIENPFEEVIHQSILKAADFVDWVRQKLPRKGQREVPSLTKLKQHIFAEPIPGPDQSFKAPHPVFYRFRNHLIKGICS